MDKQRQINTWLALIGVAVASIVLVMFWKQQRKSLRFHEEQRGFAVLGQYAADMIANREPGVGGDAEDGFIVSFEDFHTYVGRCRPDLVAPQHMPNPFPGLLPSSSYARRSTPATQPTDLLFWSNEIHDRSVDFQFRLRCDGALKSLVGSEHGIRMAPTSRARTP